MLIQPTKRTKSDDKSGMIEREIIVRFHVFSYSDEGRSATVLSRILSRFRFYQTSEHIVLECDKLCEFFINSSLSTIEISLKKTYYRLERYTSH